MNIIVLSFLITGLLLFTGCLKAPDGNMGLGDATTSDQIDQALSDAQTGITVEKSFHNGDTGIIGTNQTTPSGSQNVSEIRWTITSADADFFYIDKVDLKDSNPDTNTIKYKLAKATATSTSTASLSFNNLKKSKFILFITRIKSKISQLLARITVRPSSAVSAELTVQPKVDNTATHQYYGLKSYAHLVTTSNYSVSATHIEYNDVISQNGKTQQIRYTAEISRDVPGLFTLLSKCLSTIQMNGNVQIPFMLCESVDDFKSGSN
jgi:hypothetical protein